MSLGPLPNLTSYGGGGELDQKCKEEGASLYIQIMGTIIFVLVWPFIVLDMKWFPLGRPAAAMVGGGLMVVFTIVGQLETYDIQGELGNMQTIFLLVGMMMLSYYYDREGLLRLVAITIIGGEAKSFKFILWKVCLLSAVLSALITNDAAVLVLTPLLLLEFKKQKRSKRELLPLCLGIATAANIGSAATVFGNPQNAFIAAYAGVNLLQFFAALLPAALIGTVVDIVLLYLFFWRTVFDKYDKTDDENMGTDSVQGNYTVPGTLAEERESIALSYDQSQDPYLSSRIAAERGQLYDKDNHSSSYQRRQRQNSTSPYPRSKNVPDIRVDGDKAPLVENSNGKEYGSESSDIDIVKIKSIKERNWRERSFMVWLVFITFCVVVLLAIPPPPTVPVQFNLGLVPVGASVFTMLVDTILMKTYAYDAMLKIDWTVILMFMGLFVWLGGFQNTCYPEILFDYSADYMNLYRVEGVLLFTVFVIVGSNIFSNVPLTILIVDRIKVLCGENECEGPLGGLLLAWISTIAGNFTLIGSVANLIVAEKARGTVGYRVTFWNYFKFGGFSTTIILFSMLPIVYFVGANI